MENQFPRINGKLFSKFYGRIVMLICEAKNLDRNGNVLLVTSDGLEVVGMLPMGEQIGSKYVHVIGKVLNSTSIECHQIQPVGENFDLSLYNKVVDLACGQYGELFQ